MLHKIKCTECDGEGVVDVVKDEVSGIEFTHYTKEKEERCMQCKGEGLVDKNVCECECDECESSYYIVDNGAYISRCKNLIAAVLDAHGLSVKKKIAIEVYKGTRSMIPVFISWGDEYILRDIGRSELHTKEMVNV